MSVLSADLHTFFSAKASIDDLEAKFRTAREVKREQRTAGALSPSRRCVDGPAFRRVLRGADGNRSVVDQVPTAVADFS